MDDNSPYRVRYANTVEEWQKFSHTIRYNGADTRLGFERPDRLKEAKLEIKMEAAIISANADEVRQVTQNIRDDYAARDYTDEAQREKDSQQAVAEMLQALYSDAYGRIWPAIYIEAMLVSKPEGFKLGQLAPLQRGELEREVTLWYTKRHPTEKPEDGEAGDEAATDTDGDSAGETERPTEPDPPARNKVGRTQRASEGSSAEGERYSQA